MIDASLKSALAASSSVTALVASRIYPISAPEQAPLPVLVYQKVGTIRGLHHGGSLKVATSTFQISCISSGVTEAKTLAEAVIGALHGYVNKSGTPKIYRCQVSEEIDLFQPEIDDYVVAVDVEITHSEAW